MKFAEQHFPKGIFPGQESDGAYLDGLLATNLDVIVKKISHDMHFLGLITGNDSVGNGKSTMATHVGCYLTDSINKKYNLNNTFTDENMVFNSEKLSEISFKLPKYSVIVLDEGDDLTTHGMKDLAVRLKRYFRKCRQLNQILILVLPSFFELPKFYALSRSHFLINVKFENEFDRGYFKFYSTYNKKLLYLKGKKEWNYDAYKENFKGRFFGSYCFFPNVKECTEKYKQKKYSDMVDDAKEKEENKTEADIIRETTIKLYYKFVKAFVDTKKISRKELNELMNITDATGINWRHEVEKPIPEEDNLVQKVPILLTN